MNNLGVIVEQGKMGTTFFVTHSGTLEVSVNGNLATLGGFIFRLSCLTFLGKLSTIWHIWLCISAGLNIQHQPVELVGTKFIFTRCFNHILTSNYVYCTPQSSELLNIWTYSYVKTNNNNNNNNNKQQATSNKQQATTTFQVSHHLESHNWNLHQSCF